VGVQVERALSGEGAEVRGVRWILSNLVAALVKFVWISFVFIGYFVRSIFLYSFFPALFA
jgi:hypothetical protein